MNTTPLFIAGRLQLSGRGRTSRAATGIVVAVTGIALSIVVMMVAIAVMKGFKNEIRRKVTGFEAQLSIERPTGTYAADNSEALLYVSPIALTPQLAAAIDTLESELGTHVARWLSISRPMILKTPTGFKGVVARGIDGAAGLDFIAGNIVGGTMPDFGADEARNALVVSAPTASELELSPGDKIQACFFGDGNIRVRNLTVAAIYDTHFSDYDRVYAFTSPALLRGIEKLPPDRATRIELAGMNDADVDYASSRLNSLLLDNLYTRRDTAVYRVDNVHHRGALYFNWLELLDTNVDVIICLMAIVAAFTLISSMFIIILEKVRMIGVLKSLGASNSFVRRIFIILAERIAVRGMITGNTIALLLLWIQHRWHIVPLDPSTYYLSYVPVELTIADVLLLNLGVVVISIIVLILPSQLAAKISPARSIRYE